MAEYILHPLRLQEIAKNWLLEDASSFDYSGAAIGEQDGEFVILVKSPGILAGIPFANVIFELLGLKATWLCKDGDRVTPITEIAIVTGLARHLLLAERVVLNVLSRASGVATATANMVSELRSVRWQGRLAGSRKTTPGFRMVEKFGLLIGGADMHRFDLSEMVMLKDNHVNLSGSIDKAVQNVRKFSGFTHKIEVECSSLSEAFQAADAGADIIMLDNFKPQDLHETATEVKMKFPDVLIEASGGIAFHNIKDYASPFIDIISSSSLIQGYNTIDISMKAKKKI